MRGKAKKKDVSGVDIFQHSTLRDYLSAMKPGYTLKELASLVGISYQAIGFIFADNKEHWVLGHLAGFKKAFQLKRDEGAYFELLAIIAAYSFEDDRVPLLKRAYHLAGRLEASLNADQGIASSLVYWLDPLCSLLRNAVELADFPLDEEQIPKWVGDHVATLGAVDSTAPRVFYPRVAVSWSWLRAIGAVVFDEKLGRWAKTTPLVVSQGHFGVDLKSIRDAVFALVFTDMFHDFASDVAAQQKDERVFVTKFGTFSLSARNLELVRQLCTDFVVETVQKVGFACNDQDMERLRESDPKLHQEALAYRAMLQEKQLPLEPTTDQDIDTVVQIVLAARRLLS